MSESDAEFGAYFAGRAESLRSTAFLLCGNWHQAEDLVQTAFVKMYVAWHRVCRHEALDAYLRRVLLRVFLDERRRSWRREHPTAVVPDTAAAGGEPEERLVLFQALSAVPPRQRAALVLRFWEDLSVEETARALGCSPGTVKSQTSKGLQALRRHLADTVTLAGEPSRKGS